MGQDFVNDRFANGMHDNGVYGNGGHGGGEPGSTRSGGRPQRRIPPVLGDTHDGPVTEEVLQLVEAAQIAAREGRVLEAERLTYEILEHGLFPPALDNLALVQLDFRKKPKEALRLVQHNLDHPTQLWQPSSRAIAARCHIALGDPEEGRRLVDQAIRDFELGLADRKDAPREQQRAWREHVSRILQAAGELGDHEWTWQLYQRWEREHVLASSHFYGGVAAFNQNQFREAGRAWRRGLKIERGVLNAFAALAQWCRAGLIEPFQLEYDFSGPNSTLPLVHLLNMIREGRFADSWRGHDDDPLRLEARIFTPMLSEFIRRPANRVAFVLSVFEPFLPSGFPSVEAEFALEGVRHLIAAGGDWGEATAKRLFLAQRVDRRVKEAAVEGLVQAGRLSRNEPVRMWVDGKVRDVVVPR